MHFTTLAAAILASVVTAAPYLVARQASTDASVVTDNPAGVVYKATFEPSKDDEFQISGYVTATSEGPGKPVKFDIQVNGLPDNELGPCGYHIHVDPIGADGNCTKALAHLDQFARGEKLPCDSSDPKSCQQGDLSGKHKKMTGPSFHDSYTDKYVSLREGDGAFFGNRSIVIHNKDKTRIACTNWELISGGGGNGYEGNGYGGKGYGANGYGANGCGANGYRGDAYGGHGKPDHQQPPSYDSDAQVSAEAITQASGVIAKAVAIAQANSGKAIANAVALEQSNA